jgi:4-amino-4-deoxy-L-arabinose transferase-like glycosyltransferase
VTLPSDARTPRREFRSLVAVTLVAALAALALGIAVLSRASLPYWDEATYIFNGKYLADALAAGDFDRFGRFTMHQMEKPFVHSWMLVPTFALFPGTSATARAVSLVLYAGCAVLVFLLTGRGSPRRSGAFVAAAMFLASPIVMEYATQAMLEVPGTFLTLATLLVFLRARERGSPALHVLASVLLAATFLLKYNYGLILGLALAMEIAIEAARREVRLRDALRLAVPAAVMIAYWFSHPFPEKLRALFAFTVNRANVESVLAPASLLFYPRELVHRYHFAPVFSLLSGTGLVLAAWRSRTRADARTLVLTFGVGVVLMTFHPYKLDRAIITVAPVLFIAGGTAVDALGERRPRLGRIVAVAVAALAALALVAQSIRMAATATAESDPRRAEALAAVVDALDPSARNLVLGEFNELSPSLIQFTAFERAGRNYALDVGCPVPDDVFTRRGVFRDFRPSICESAARRIAATKADVLVVLDVSESSPLWTSDYTTWNAWKRHIPACIAARADYRPVAARDVGPGVVAVRVFRRR